MKGVIANGLFLLQSRDVSEDASQFGKRIAENFDDDQVRGPLLDTLVELYVSEKDHEANRNLLLSP
jgi:hypothetical protein